VSAETSKYAAPTAAATPRDSAAGTARAEPRSALFPSTVRTMCGPTCTLDGQQVSYDAHAGKQPCAVQGKNTGPYQRLQLRDPGADALQRVGVCQVEDEQRLSDQALLSGGARSAARLRKGKKRQGLALTALASR
jgi:hypothetical protein